MSTLNTNSPLSGSGETRKRQGPLYDSLAVANAATIAVGTTNLFNGNIMDSGGLGPDFTNMGDIGKLSNMVKFTVASIRLVFFAAQADITAFCKTTCVRFHCAGIKMVEAPPDYFPGGAGVSGNASNGLNDPRAVVTFDLDPIEITAGMQFRMGFTLSTLFTATATFFMRAYLDGEIEEAI